MVTMHDISDNCVIKLHITITYLNITINSR